MHITRIMIMVDVSIQLSFLGIAVAPPLSGTPAQIPACGFPVPGSSF
jgi:hypothetical protein